VEFFCDSHVHESCDPDEDLDELQVLFAAVSGDEEHLRELLGENRESVLLNLGRNAIQFIGCDGHVGLHVQLDPELVARLKLKN
jgi:hypothetical protein